MKQLSLKQRQWLKAFHLLAASVWISSGIIILLFYLIGQNISNGDHLYMLNYLTDFIDMKILVPSAMLCLFTGLFYSLFTKWGFFKHRWLVFKWIITVGIIVLGTVFTGPWVEEMVQLSLKEGIAVLKNSHYLAIGRSQFVMGACMNITLITAVFVSVFKPWKKSKK